MPMPWYLGAGLAVLILGALWVAFILRGSPEEHDAKISEQTGIDRRTLLSRIADRSTRNQARQRGAGELH